VISRPRQVQAIGRELRFEEVAVREARAQMLADGRPPALVDALLSAAENRAASSLVTPTVADLTGRPPRGFQRWARDHRESFRLKERRPPSGTRLSVPREGGERGLTPRPPTSWTPGRDWQRS
jgi:hypothetical protein